jgi:predicted NBD/HSP70 family sugar kinase
LTVVAQRPLEGGGNLYHPPEALKEKLIDSLPDCSHPKASMEHSVILLIIAKQSNSNHCSTAFCVVWINSGFGSYSPSPQFVRCRLFWWFDQSAEHFGVGWRGDTVSGLVVEPRYRPFLDPDFVPAVLWNRAYEARAERDHKSTPLVVAVTRSDGTVFSHETRIAPHESENIPLNLKYVERIVKLLLWMKGGSGIVIAGQPELARAVSDLYIPGGARSFDCDIVARRIFLQPMTVTSCNLDDVPEDRIAAIPLGGHLDGCRIGFDLGGSDRKCAAVVDGEVVHSEEVEWDPYFESDPRYHFDGIMDSLRRAAAHLPRVDAIGGSAAGVYVDNEPRAGSLFRGISEEDFEREIRLIFKRIRREMSDVPFEVVNDGEVTALAASLAFDTSRILGIAMGTSLAAGYCDNDGRITGQLNELAFVPVDYRDDAPVDEWSGDVGCGVQYFSQQAVARLAPAVGLEHPDHIPFAERLVDIQSLMKRGDERARRIYESIGVYLGYSVAWFARWYETDNLLTLGRVTSGVGGEIIIETAMEVLRDEFPELADHVRMKTPDEEFKRHGQAIAAASLPVLSSTSASPR